MSFNSDENNIIDEVNTSEGALNREEKIQEESTGTEIDFENLDYETILNKMDPEIREKINNGEIPPEVQELLSSFLGAIEEIQTGKRRIEVAKNLLEDKYKKEFEILHYRGQSITDDHYKVEAYEKNNPYMIFEARIKLDELSVSDSYATHLACQMIKDRISKNMDEIDGDIEIYVEPWIQFLTITDTKIDENTLERVVPNYKLDIHLFFETSERRANITADDFSKMLCGLEGYKGSINIFVVTKEEEKQIFEYIESRSKLHSSYWKMTKNNYLGRLKFFDGQVQADEKLLLKLQEKMK